MAATTPMSSGSELNDEESAACPEHRQNQAFREKLPQQAATAGADGQPHGHLVTARERADEQQIAHIRAGD